MKKIDYYNEEKENLGKEDIKTIHDKGLLYFSAHVWIINQEDKILIQKRNINSRLFPGYWQASSAGHKDTGENLKETAIRETCEELDLAISDSEITRQLDFRSCTLYNKCINNEIIRLFFIQKNFNKQDTNPSKREVENIKLVTIDELEKMVKENNFIPFTQEYYKTVIKNIKELINEKV